MKDTYLDWLPESSSKVEGYVGVISIKKNKTGEIVGSISFNVGVIPESVKVTFYPE